MVIQEGLALKEIQVSEDLQDYLAYQVLQENQDYLVAKDLAREILKICEL